MILYEIINVVYGVASAGTGYRQTLSRVDAALKKLSSWQEELPSCLRLPDDGSIPDRARITLHLNYNQASTSALDSASRRATDFSAVDNSMYAAVVIPSC